MDSHYYGVKYYGKNDLTIGLNLEKAEKIIKAYDRNRTDYSINDVLELYNICLLFDDKLRLKSWSNEDYNSMNSIIEEFKARIGAYFSKANYSEIDSFYPEISVQYDDTFWEIFAYYKIYNKLSPTEFSKILVKYKVPIYLILREKMIVKYYDIEISKYMQHSNSTAEILIIHHLERDDLNHKKYYIPKSLTTDDQLSIIEKYVESEASNPNYLKLLYKSRGKKEFPISDEIRLKAKKRYDSNIKKLFSNGAGLSFGATVGFADSNEIISITDKDSLHTEIIYSRLWLKENLDNPTLLNNYIYLFGYVDRFFRSTFPSNKNELGAIERYLGVKGDREYDKGVFFEHKEMISSMQTKSYYYEILKLDKRLEDIFKWFFEKYLNEEFKAEGFILSIPAMESSFLEKMRTMCSELESILRQFDSYVKNGEINRELLEISRNSLLIEDIPSFIPQKYGYVVDSELIDISHQLFSNQSVLAYVEYSNFENFIENKKVSVSDFYDYQKSSLNWLMEKNIIYEGCHGYLQPNIEIVKLLKDYYENEVICINYYKNNTILKSLISENKIICESKLFSRPEQAYLNFKLNDRQFDNGPALRNKYLHGSSSLNFEENENDYFELLKIFALVIIKFNEEFCLIV